MLGQAISAQLAVNDEREDYERRIRLKSITTQLLQYIAQESEFLDGLRKHPEELLEFTSAGGVALLFGGKCTLVGQCPAEGQIWRVVEWLVGRGRDEIYSTDCLPALMPETGKYKDVASGVLGISISKIHNSYILWFRPEVTRTVSWGGDPRKPATQAADSAGRLHPRKSFESWKEIVSGRSLPWHETEVEAAAELRNALIGVVLRKAEEMAQLSEELRRSNRELEAFSYSVSHDLRAPFRHIAGYAHLLKQSSAAKLDQKDLRYLDIITQSAQFAGTLVDNLLSFSKVGRAPLKLQPVATETVVRDVILSLKSEIGDRQIAWKIQPLPIVQADLTLFRLVWQNLLQNAIKYTRACEQAIISVAAESNEKEVVFRVRDNGVGFEQQYADKLFGVFQRLHKMEDYEGTGIGLANVRRIVTRHGGRTWAEGAVGKGAAIYFSIPAHDSDAP